MTTPQIPAQDGLAQPRQAIAMIALFISCLAAILDGSMVNIALPTIARVQGIDPSDAIWIVTANQIATAGVLLPLAALGEIIGFKKVYLGGIVLFILAAIASAGSNDLLTLALARAAQGIGCAAILSINSALVRYTMPSSRLGTGLAAMSMVIGVSAAIAPTIGATILQTLSWRWIFLFDVPLGVISLLLGWLALPESPGSKKSFDIPGALLNAAAFGFFITGLKSLANPSLWILTLIQWAIALGALLALLRHQKTQAAPLFPVDLLRRAQFTLPTLASFLTFIGQLIALISFPFFFQIELGLSPLKTGLLIMPWPIMSTLLAMLAGPLSDRFSPRHLCALGMVVFGTAFLLVGLLKPGAAEFDIVWRMALCGIGFGLFHTPNSKEIISSAPKERSGGASGMQSTARMFGQAVGAALGAVLMALVVPMNMHLIMACASTLAFGSAIITVVSILWPGSSQGVAAPAPDAHS